ncbi:hypothetical protein [Chryseolinea lacunae]|uniref:Uncharacterized protein n=1 Tax=Chryseolinea lacunae TaxID=2801331 RepID=A0ABS1KY08_9BACT|nr:hypothetical protein [Chryseolinea lacunae]MBL0744188.1 hypothetical protein [Chryseolinea lacunae]
MATSIEADFRKRLNVALSPFIEMLEAKKELLPKDDWMRLVYRVESSIIDTPDQYLKGEYPSRILFQTIVAEIFQEFLKEDGN